MDDALAKQADEWFDRGSRDLATAELILAHGGHVEMAAYHVQQALEKALKGGLVLSGRQPPRIHDLDELLALAAVHNPNVYHRFIALCERATRYYIDARYPPAPTPRYSADDLRIEIRTAVELFDWLHGETTGDNA